MSGMQTFRSYSFKVLRSCSQYLLRIVLRSQYRSRLTKKYCVTNTAPFFNTLQVTFTKNLVVIHNQNEMDIQLMPFLLLKYCCD